MPKVRLRWHDREWEEFDALGPPLPALMVLPDGEGGVVNFRLTTDPNPPDPERSASLRRGVSFGLATPHGTW